MHWKLLTIAAALNVLISAPAGAQNSRWGAGYFPNVELTTQDGKVVHFYDDLIKGKIVAIDLIYTTCQYACPLETARLAQVQKLIGDRMGRDVFFYSITIDPDHDTPPVLKEYAAKFGAGPGWLFLTGKMSDIELISKKTGLYSEPNPSNPDGHTPSLLVGNEVTGQWMRNSALDNPKFLARTIGDWLNSWQTSKKTNVVSFADAPVMKIDLGLYKFNNHCAACHSIGSGDRIGPDLAGVMTTRDRDWLKTMIATPDKLFAAKDPIAMALRAKYNDVLMPNLALADDDVAAIMGYLESQGHAVASGQTRSSSDAAKNADTSGRLARMVDLYLRIPQSLNADKTDGIKDTADRIVSIAATMGDRGYAVFKAAGDMKDAVDLAAARSALGPLTDAMLALSRSGETLGDGVKVAYCPMARKSWLQKGDTIRNPYYGQSMSECGRFVETTSTR
jgi:protein SCO1